MYYSAVCPSPLGMLTLGSDGEHLIGLWLEGQKYFGGAVREALEERDGQAVISFKNTSRAPLDIPAGNSSGSRSPVPF